MDEQRNAFLALLGSLATIGTVVFKTGKEATRKLFIPADLKPDDGFVQTCVNRINTTMANAKKEIYVSRALKFNIVDGKVSGFTDAVLEGRPTSDNAKICFLLNVRHGAI